jgi:2-polyprenyl-3-methyl-5-hydroxy-6-metoxy-1,4-benzoquinol methylase
LYSGDYVAATYGTNLNTTFDRIVNLDTSKSDNAHRALRVHNFNSNWQKSELALTILDVGSGTGVFPYAMKNLGWICTAIDPDPIACEHIERRLGIQTICGDFFNLDLEKIGKFSLISFNKVLEHIENPIEMLVAGGELLSKKGIIYVEVPDGDSAFRANPAHEEFFIEHHHAFSISSLSLLIERSGLICLEINRIVEPSGKFTIYCFASKAE